MHHRSWLTKGTTIPCNEAHKLIANLSLLLRERSKWETRYLLKSMPQALQRSTRCPDLLSTQPLRQSGVDCLPLAEQALLAQTGGPAKETCLDLISLAVCLAVSAANWRR